MTFDHEEYDPLIFVHQIPLTGWFEGQISAQNSQKKFWAYNKAQKYVQNLGLQTLEDWKEYCKSGKKPKEIPTNPNRTYKEEWTRWGDWLGNDKITNQEIYQNYLPWKEAKPIYRKLGGKYGLNNRADWKKFSKTHKKLLNGLRLPLEPWQTYTLERVWRKMKWKNGDLFHKQEILKVNWN